MSDSSQIHADLGHLAEQLDEVVRADQPTAAFWARLLETYCALSGAGRALLLVRRATERNWRKVAFHEAIPPSDDALKPEAAFQRAALAVAENVLNQDGELSPVGKTGALLGGLRLRLLQDDNVCVAVFLFEGALTNVAGEAMGRLQLVSTAPRTFQAQQAARVGKQDVEKFAQVVDWLIPVNDEKHFLAAALALCNGVASSLACDRVSLGWHEGGYMRLKALSRMEDFNRQMAAAQALEAAMDETCDQDDLIVWPLPDDATVIARDHEKFSRSQEVAHLCSLPLHSGGEAVAVLLCERDARAFTVTEAQQLRLLADLAIPRLTDLRARDRWFGARWGAGLKDFFAGLVGPEHTWAKVLALAVLALLLAVFFIKIDYRVEGDFILKSDAVLYLTAPYDGFIEDVYEQSAGEVKQGDILLRMQTDELLLQEAAELANVNAYARQAEKARAVNQLADMRIAEAQVKQAEARLAIVRHRLGQAEIRAPFDAVIIEGDLRELRGKPIAKGDGLFKLAQLDALYVEAEIDERDLHEILESKSGEIAFVSQPKFKFPVEVSEMEPVALPSKEGNISRIRCEPVNGPQTWWRPGFTGVCKIDVEKRSLLWIFGHRTVDFLRMWLWW